jgi:hypothetical protein
MDFGLTASTRTPFATRHSKKDPNQFAEAFATFVLANHQGGSVTVEAKDQEAPPL